MMSRQLLFLITSFISCIGFTQGGEICSEMEIICSDEGLAYTGGIGEDAEIGNDYGCLLTQPNPNWFYVEISVSGNIELELSAGSDIDFIIWGPFANLSDARSNCGTLGDSINSPIVDCSYSAAAFETPEIPAGIVGEVYVFMITNYAMVVQDITAAKIGGTGDFECDIPELCIVDVGTFNGKHNREIIDLNDVKIIPSI